jgi:signal peptidase complex subunit 3
MYNIWNRLNALFFFSISVLIAASATTYLSTLLSNPSIQVNSLAINDLKALRPMKEPSSRKMIDRAIFSFDLDADLTNLFNWNVKQVFVFITVEFKTKSSATNQVTIWDSIIPDKSRAVLKYNDAMVKYPLFDQKDQLRGEPVRLVLNWDIMPTTGLLHLGKRKGSHAVSLPAEYCDKECALEKL